MTPRKLHLLRRLVLRLVLHPWRARLTPAFACLAVACLGLVGCSGPERLATSFDPCRATALVVEGEPPSGRLDAVAAGLAAWREALTMPWTASTEAARPEAVAIPVRFVDVGWFFGRFEDEEGAIALSNAVTDPGALAVVTAHEIGHALGLYHVNASERSSVMNPGNVAVLPTEADLREVVALWGTCLPTSPESPSRAN